GKFLPVLQGRFTALHVFTVGQRNEAVSLDRFAGLADALSGRPCRCGFVAFAVLGFAAFGAWLTYQCSPDEMLIARDGNFHLTIGENGLTCRIAVNPRIADRFAVPPVGNWVVYNRFKRYVWQVAIIVICCFHSGIRCDRLSGRLAQVAASVGHFLLY